VLAELFLALSRLSFGVHSFLPFLLPQVKRYCTWPGQAVGYKVGELELWRLRRRFEAALGDRADVKGFHDLVCAALGLRL
jgi:hypothetical protein